MEAKGEAKSEAGGKSEGGGPQQSVVINLLNFAMRVVHEEMAGFFDEHCSHWDYGEEDLKAIMAGGGETLQQHDIFTKYLALINDHLDNFARSAGYTSAQEVFAAVEEAVARDKRQREKMMSEMNAMFAQMRLKAKAKEGDAKAEEKGDAGGGAKGGDDDDGDGGGGGGDAKAEAKGGGEAKATARGKAGGGTPGGLMLFSQPIGLEYLLDSVLNLADYETLRMMMIMKAREKRMYRQLEERGAKRRSLAAARKDDLVPGCSPRVVTSQYEALKTRLAEMTPHRKDLHEELVAGMSTRKLEDDADRAEADADCYKYPLDFLTKVSAPNAQEELKAKAEKLKDDRASHVDYLNTIHDHIDAIHDNIEQCMLAARRDPVSGGAAPAAADAKAVRADAKG